MAEISLYSAWTMKLSLPQPFQDLVGQSGVKRISCNEADCSCHNKRQQGKSAKLHPPTLSAVLGLIGIKDGTASGACGIQKRDEINYFLMEYEKPEGRCVLAYNYRNGRFTGQRILNGNKEKLLCVAADKSTGEEYLALLAYASVITESPLYDTEFADYYGVLEDQYQRGFQEPEKALRAAFICCDNLYRRITAAQVWAKMKRNPLFLFKLLTRMAGCRRSCGRWRKREWTRRSIRR